jgi:aldehyde dehydrogenase (NAD+)
MSRQSKTSLPETARFVFHEEKKHFWDGRWIESQHTQRLPVMDPCTGETLTTIPLAGAAEVDSAVRAAHDAFSAWGAKPAVERAVILHRFADAIERNTAILAQIEALDVGKPVTNAEAFDVPFGAACLRYYADLSVHAQYDTPLAIRNMEARVHRSAYGPCAFIFPWNFPFTLLLWGIAPALAAGNTVVVKPAETTPLSTLYACKLAEEAGVPPGVINVVLGDGLEAGAALVSHPLIRRMSFTGSTTVGKQIGATCGRNLVPCKLELGGKGAALVLDDADVDDAAKKLASAITLNTGQVCCTATRWIVHESVFDRLVEGAKAALESVRIGLSLDHDTEMGPLASEKQLKTVLNYLERGAKEGAESILNGGNAQASSANGGYYVTPSLLGGSADNICCREEIFGPIAYLVKFRKDAEAIEITNSLRYGLANSVWSSDLARANKLAEQLIAGNTWINAHNVFAYGLPYGGVNLSGMGGGVNSLETFYDYLRSETIARPLP